MFIKENYGFEMFGRAVARRDVPTDYYVGGVYDGHLEVIEGELCMAAIAQNPKGWAIYPFHRINNLEDGPAFPLHGLYFDTVDEAAAYADGIAHKA